MDFKNYLLAVIITFCIVSWVNFVTAQVQAPFTPVTPLISTQTKIDMHEWMSKIHQKDADCLKIGRTDKDCHASLMLECYEYSKSVPALDCAAVDKILRMDGSINR